MDANDSVQGAALADGRTIEFLDAAEVPLQPTCEINLGKGKANDWPLQDSLAQRAFEMGNRAGVRQYLSVYLPWTPDLLEKAYAGQEDLQAEWCLMLWEMAALLEKNGALDLTRMRLEQFGYQALARVYEQEPAQSTRLRGLEQSYRLAFRRWQGRIVNPDNAVYFLENDLRETREEAMNRLLWQQTDDGRERLWRFLREHPRGREAVTNVAERWYLPRYDLATAERLRGALGSSRQGQAKGGFLDDGSDRLLRVVRWSHWFVIVVLAVYLMVAVWPAAGAALGARGNWLTWVWMGVYAFGGIPWLLYMIASRRPDTTTPRLAAGILLAAIGTALQQNWGGLTSFVYGGPPAKRFVVVLVLVIFVLVATWGFLFSRIVRVTERRWNDPAVHRRCLLVLLRGLALAFLVSLLLVDLLGTSYVESHRCSTNSHSLWAACVPGAIGYTFPGLVLVLMSFILFVGVLAQLVIEERALTEAVL